MRRRTLVLLVPFALAAAVACDRGTPLAPPLTPPDATPPDTRPAPAAPGGALGLVEVAITGIGSGQPSATAAPYRPGTAGPRFDLGAVTNNAALALDGAGDYVSANAVALDMVSAVALTLEAWVRPEAESGGQQAILSFHTTDGNILNPQLINLNMLFYEPDRDGFAYYDESQGYVRTGETGGTGQTYPPGRWVHVALVIDASDQGTLYIDGTPQASFTTAVRPEVDAFLNGFFSIGQEYDAPNVPTDFLRGRIDEVRLWKVARSEAEIQADMGGEIDPATPGLAAYFRFGEASGTTTSDLAGGHDGGLVGDAALGASGPELEGAGDGTIQLEPLSTGSFTSGVRGGGGYRYLYATFRVRNAQEDGTPYETPRENLTFLAVDTDGSLGSTAVTALTRFDGSPITGAQAASLAESLIPTGRAVGDPAASSGLRPYKPDVLQVLTEDEAADVLESAPTSVNTVFPYGFVVRSPGTTPGSRTLPASPAVDRFDGIITFAFKLPLQASAAEDPFEMRVVFLPVQDSEVRITKSIEEGTPEGADAIRRRVDELAGGGEPVTVTVLGASPTLIGDHGMRRICTVRTAGDDPSSPLATLVDVGAPACRDADAVLPSHVRVVDADAAGAGGGRNWPNAFPTLQDALACVREDAGTGAACEGVTEIWVAEGTYHPDEGAGQTDNDRHSTFQLVSGVAIYGGFAGTEPSRSARDWRTHPTVLSGDLAGDDGADFANNAENSYHVVASSGADGTAVLDGFTITGGNANGESLDDRGGGVFNDPGSPTLTNITITGNSAAGNGGGMFNTNSSPTLTNAIITGNAAGRHGGGIYTAGVGAPGTLPSLTNVVIAGNSAGFNGGGIATAGSSPVLTNVTMIGNTAEFSGGGMFNIHSSSMILNSILRGNIGGAAAAQIVNSGSTLTIRHSLVQGSGGSGAGWDTSLGSDDGGNLDADPLFLDASTTDGDGLDLHLGTNSPAIDAGLNSDVPTGVDTDLDGDPRVVDGDANDTATVDLGAYERQ